MTNSDRGGDLITEIMFATAHEYAWPDYTPKERVRTKLDPAIFGDYVGRYEIQPGLVASISMKNGQLVANTPGQEEVELLPESPTTFFILTDDIEFVFKRDHAGKVESIGVHRAGGSSFTAKRIE